MPYLLLFLCLTIFLPLSQARQKVEVYRYTNQAGTVVFSDKKPPNQIFKILKYDCYVCQKHSNVNWSNTPLFTRKYHQIIRQASNKHQLDPALVKAIIHAESAFNPNATSQTGAMGLMQLMPATAKALNVNNPYDAEKNIHGGTQYFAQLLNQFKGSVTLASAAYNAGPSVVKKYQGVPPYPETKNYVERVKILYRRYRLL